MHGGVSGTKMLICCISEPFCESYEEENIRGTHHFRVCKATTFGKCETGKRGGEAPGQEEEERVMRIAYWGLSDALMGWA